MPAHPVRFLAESKNPSRDLLDAISGKALFCWRAVDINLQIALADNGTFLLAAGVGTITVEIKHHAAQAQDAAIFSDEFVSADCSSGFAASQWAAGGGQLLSAVIHREDLTLPPGDYRLIIRHEKDGISNTYASTTLRVLDSQQGSEDIIPPNAPGWWLNAYAVLHDRLMSLTTEAQGRSRQNIGLGNVNNTSDAAKPISTAVAAALSALTTSVSALEALLESDDVTLDQLQEIVNYIKENREQLDDLGIASIPGLQEALDSKGPATIPFSESFGESVALEQSMAGAHLKAKYSADFEIVIPAESTTPISETSRFLITNTSTLYKLTFVIEASGSAEVLGPADFVLLPGESAEWVRREFADHWIYLRYGSSAPLARKDGSNVSENAEGWHEALGLSTTIRNATSTPHRIKLRRSAPFSLSTAAHTFNQIPFDTTEFATDPTAADLANDRIICPRAGWYRILTAGALKDIGTPIPRIVIRVVKYSAANLYQGPVLWRDRHNYGGWESLGECVEVYLNKGDQLDLAYYKDVTDAAAIEDEGTYYNPALEIHEAHPTPLPVKAPALTRKIITDGDSNTSGLLCGADEVWTKWLTSGTILNRAAAGRTVAQILVDSASIVSGADITADYILAASVNDLGFNVGSDLEELADKIEEIFDIAAPLHRSVTWITPAKVNYPGYANNAAINAEIEDLISIVAGRDLGINIVNLYDDEILGSASIPLSMLDLIWRVDGLHFSPLGEKRIADLTAPFLV